MIEQGPGAGKSSPAHSTLGSTLSQPAHHGANASLPGLGCFGLLDREHEPQLVAVRQRIEESPRVRVAVEGGREVRAARLPREAQWGPEPRHLDAEEVLAAASK